MATGPRSVGSSEARLGTGTIDLCPEQCTQFPEPDPALVSKVQERSPALDCIVAPTTHPSTMSSGLSSRRMSRAFFFPTTPAAGYALESKFPLKTGALASHAPAQIDPSARPCPFVLGTAGWFQPKTPCRNSKHLVRSTADLSSTQFFVAAPSHRQRLPSLPRQKT